MQKSSTPLAEYLPAIRDILGAKGQEAHPVGGMVEAIKLLLNTGRIPGHRLSGDGIRVEPALTPDTDQTAYALLIKKTALMLKGSLTKDQRFDLEAEIYKLESGGMCGG